MASDAQGRARAGGVIGASMCPSHVPMCVPLAGVHRGRRHLHLEVTAAPKDLCFRAAARQSGESDQEQFGVVHRMTKAGASQSVIGATKVLAAHGGAAGCGARLQATRSSRELHKRANRRCMGVRIENE